MYIYFLLFVCVNQGQATIVKYQTCIDSDTKGQLENNVLKHKTHPGVFRKSTVTLPSMLEEAVKRLLQGWYRVTK